jgi:hypothetical protein
MAHDTGRTQAAAFMARDLALLLIPAKAARAGRGGMLAP